MAKEQGPPLQEQEEKVAEAPLPLQAVEAVEAAEAFLLYYLYHH
jgi:hypothetical protein